MKSLKFVKGILVKEPVLFMAGLAALLSMIAVPPSGAYVEYVDFSVLSILFCLMITIAGFQKMDVFAMFSARLLSATNDSRKIIFLLVNMTFFSAMLITNDVALLTFVPLTIGILAVKYPRQLIFTVVMETIAANLGSMVTPIGNPQNLYLFSYFHMGIPEFLKTMLPLGIMGYGLLMIPIAMRKRVSVSADVHTVSKIQNKKHLIIYFLLFLLSILSVLRVVDYRLCLLITGMVILITDRSLFRFVDYGLLLTFLAFFIFVGNVGKIDPIRETVQTWMEGREILVSVLLSQFISNVPAAVMLSGFTQEAGKLLTGVNIGGLGTLVASLASLISYKLYVKSQGANAKQYIKMFTAYNLLYLVIMAGAACSGILP